MKIDIEDWCKLCDAIGIPPDAGVDRVIKMATRKEELFMKYKKEIHILEQKLIHIVS